MVELTSKFAHECWAYNKETGKLFWKNRPRKHFNTARGYHYFNTCYPGKEVGSINSNKYLTIRFNNKTYQVHRIIWLLETGEFPINEIDHINHNRQDNRWSNLRQVSTIGNSRNMSMKKANTSGVTNVTWRKDNNKWRAYVMLNSRQTHLGYFDTKEEAAEIVRTTLEENGFHKNHGLRI